MKRACVWSAAVAACFVTSAVAAAPNGGKADAWPRPDPAKFNPDDTHGVSLVALQVSEQGDQVKFTSDVPKAVIRVVGSAGYAISRDESVLFKDAGAAKNRFLLGGSMDRVSCTKYFDGRRCRARVTWEVFDVQTKSIVYRVATSAFVDKLVGAEGDALWEENARSLVSRKRLAELLAKTKPRPDDGPLPPMAAFKRCDDKPVQLPKGAETAIAATVVVESGSARGAGTVLSSDGLVLTAAHVLRGDEVKVVWKSGLSAKAIVTRLSSAEDLALLKVEANGLACVPSAAKPPATGDELYAVGAPLGLTFSLTRGILSGVREVDGRSLLQTDATVNAGNSGGPLLDATGRLAAVVTTKLVGEGVEGIAFGVPIASVHRALAVEEGAETSPLLSKPVDRPKVTSGPLVDDPDPLQSDHRDDDRFARKVRTPVASSARSPDSGSATFGVGVLLVGAGVTTALLGSSEGYKYAGGGVALFGAAVLVVPLVGSPKASLAPTPRMVTVAGRF